jgi:hypothetical protein
MPFESFLGLGAAVGSSPAAQTLEDQDIDYRLDALLVGMERIRARGVTAVPRSTLLAFFADDAQLRDPRVQARLRLWEEDGRVEVVGAEECYLRITARLA